MNYDAAILELDGTVYTGDERLPGAKRGVGALRDADCRLQFLTNAAVRTRRGYSKKLTGMGIPAAPDEILTSGVVTAEYLSLNRPECVPFVVGEAALVRELRAVGIDPTTTPSVADTLVVGLDRSLDYGVLTGALRTLDEGTRYVATNPDPTRPGDDGPLPSTGAITGAIEGMTGRTPDIVAGKPSSVTTEITAERLGADPEDCLLVGDRIGTDIAMGTKAGMTTVLVLSGVTDEADVEATEVRPDHVLDSLGDVESVLG